MADPLLLAKPRRQVECAAAARAGQPPRPDHRRHRHGQDHQRCKSWPRTSARIGVPVFMADVKGDLTGISAGRQGRARSSLGGAEGPRAGRPRRKSESCPTTLWDVFGEQGHPVRATVSDMGPLLLSRMLALNETQAGRAADLVFKIADDNGLLVLDLKDLRAMLQYVGDNASAVHHPVRQRLAPRASAPSSAACCRSRAQGGDKFFGEPMLNIADFMQTESAEGRHQRAGRRQADEQRRGFTPPSCCGC